VAGQAVERLPGVRDIAPVGVRETQQVIEGAVFKHQHDDVVDCRQLTGAHS